MFLIASNMEISSLQVVHIAKEVSNQTKQIKLNGMESFIMDVVSFVEFVELSWIQRLVIEFMEDHIVRSASNYDLKKAKLMNTEIH